MAIILVNIEKLYIFFNPGSELKLSLKIFSIIFYSLLLSLITGVRENCCGGGEKKGKRTHTLMYNGNKLFSSLFAFCLIRKLFFFPGKKNKQFRPSLEHCYHLFTFLEDLYEYSSIFFHHYMGRFYYIFCFGKQKEEKPQQFLISELNFLYMFFYSFIFPLAYRSEATNQT